MDFAVPVEFAVYATEIVADAVDLAAHAVAAEMTVAQFIVDALEIEADGFEFVASVAAAVGVGLIAEMAVPFPEAVHIGAVFLAAVVVAVVIVIASLDDGDDRKEAGNDGESEDGSFHKGVFWNRGN